jgi:hypothetical protein
MPAAVLTFLALAVARIATASAAEPQLAPTAIA